MTKFQESEFKRMLDEWKEGRLSTRDVIDRVDAYSEDELADKVDYCFQHVDADLLNSKQQFHRKVSIKYHLRAYVQQNGG